MLKPCIICGKEFETNYPHQVTCGGECRSEMARKKARERGRKRYQAKPKEKITCLLCGKEFQGHRGRKYCSDKCRKKAYNRNKTLRNGGVPQDETGCLCWTCIHAVPSPEKGTGCSWSRSVGKIPVEGSEYAEKIVSPCNGNRQGTKVLRIMTKCPAYERDMKARWK